MSELNPYKQQASKSIQELIQEITLLKLRIADLEAQLRWIPVSEKPTKSMYVLICHVGDDYARTSWYSENEGDFYWWGDKQDLDLWRPLPVAPKEVQQ